MKRLSSFLCILVIAVMLCGCNNDVQEPVQTEVTSSLDDIVSNHKAVLCSDSMRQALQNALCTGDYAALRAEHFTEGMHGSAYVTIENASIVEEPVFGYDWRKQQSILVYKVTSDILTTYVKYTFDSLDRLIECRSGYMEYSDNFVDVPVVGVTTVVTSAQTVEMVDEDAIELNPTHADPYFVDDTEYYDDEDYTSEQIDITDLTDITTSEYETSFNPDVIMDEYTNSITSISDFIGMIDSETAISTDINIDTTSAVQSDDF